MTDRHPTEERLLVVAPTTKDAAMTESVLTRAGVSCTFCSDLYGICRELDGGAGAILLPEEAIAQATDDRLGLWLSRQPAWSDLPVLILTRPGVDSSAISQAMKSLGNVTMLERPTRVVALVSVVRAALRARQRQYQIRDHLIEREHAFQFQAFQASIVANSDDAIVSKTLDGIILTWNAGAERIFGYTAEEAIGQSIFLLIPPGRHEEEKQILRRLRRGERIEHFETVRVAKNDRRLDVSLTVSPVRDSHGNIVAAAKIARDITGRKRVEAELREAGRRKDEFLAILAHELRNPLAPIRSSLHILRESGPHDDATRRVAEMMERQVNHMVRLVDDLFDVSRITRGKIALRKEPLQVAAIVESALETSRPQIEAAGLRLIVKVPQEPLVVSGDAVRLTQVVANLLNNAAKYTPSPGTIWLTVRRDANEVTIAVRDTGVGIPAVMLTRVFEPFTQIANGDGPKSGLGIGLSLVKNLVELHGGSVQAFSGKPGQGSEFVVRLPLEAAPAPARVPGPKPMLDTVLKSDRVLVVDDNPDAAESLGMILKLFGADVRIVHDGQAALEAMIEYRPDVVLLDIGLPGMDGYEVARRIRQMPEFAGVTLVALTGWGQAEDRQRSRSAGFDHHLVKPVDIDALQTLLMSFHR